jgi:hypothetical protein
MDALKVGYLHFIGPNARTPEADIQIKEPGRNLSTDDVGAADHQ